MSHKIGLGIQGAQRGCPPYSAAYLLQSAKTEREQRATPQLARIA